MNSTIGIVLPVWNAEATLTGQVHDLLDVLPDLGFDFELIIADDGSFDQTPEIAFELARQYPQIRVQRSQQRHGLAAATRSAIEQVDSGIVYVQASGEPLRVSDLRRVIGQYDAHSANSLALSSQLVDRLTAWGQALRQATPQERGVLKSDLESDSDSVREHTWGSETSRPTLRRACRTWNTAPKRC